MKAKHLLLMPVVAVLALQGCAPVMQKNVYRDTVCVTRNGQQDCQAVERVIETDDPGLYHGSFYFRNRGTSIGINSGYGVGYRGGFCGYNAFGIPMTCYWGCGRWKGIRGVRSILANPFSFCQKVVTIDLSMQKYITNNSKETQKLGMILATEIKSSAVICLEGDLGSGKTTFTQGLLKGLGARGPYTSPTFVIMKKYKKNIFHLDAYRVSAKDILNLGWKEMVAEKNNIIIIEWADRIKKIIPRGALWIKFENISENKRKITFK